MAFRRRNGAVLAGLAATAALLAPAQAGAATLDVSGGAIFYPGGAAESNGLVITQEAGRYVFDEGFVAIEYDTEFCEEKQAGDPGWITCATPEPLTGIVVSLGDGSDSVTTSVPVPHTLVGDAGVDTITGGPSDDALFGGDDGDTLNGGGGDDQFRGDDGLDMTPSVDAIAGQTGADDTIFYSQAASGVVVDLDAGTGGELGALDQISGVEKVFGTSHGDDMSGTAGADSLIGDEGIDDLDGRGGSDVLVGGPDGDTLTAGPDSVVDSLYGDDGNDHLFAADGSNTDDRLDCGAGTDDGQADPSDTQFECENVALGGPVTPAVTLSHHDLSTNDTTPNLGGTATDHAGDSTTITVEIFAGAAATGSPVRTLTAARDGLEWTLADEAYDATNPALPEGTYTARASQTNPGATPSTALSGPLTFTVDTTAPALALTSPQNNSTATSTRPQIVGNAGTASGDLGLEFFLERAGATGYQPVNSGSIQDGTWTMPRPNGGFFVTSVPVDLSVGTYRLWVWQEDAAGNRSANDPRVFTIADTQGPALVINSVNPDEDALGYIKDATPHFSGAAGTAPGDRTTVLVYVDKYVSGSYVDHGLAAANRSGATWSLDWPDALADGSYRVRAWQSDEAGNATMVDTTFTVDRAVPALTIASPAVAAHLAEGTTIVLSGNSSTGGGEVDSVYADVSVNVNGKWERKTGIPTGGGRETNGSWSINLGKLPPGYYYARVRLSDLAENEGAKEIVWFVDANAPPKVHVFLPERDATYRKRESVTPIVTCSDPEDGALTCQRPATLDTSTSGPKTFTASATDSRGQTTPVDVPYTVAPGPANDGITVQGIELTQGTQTYDVEQPAGTSLMRKPRIPFEMQRAKYNGVNLVKNKPTMARVFVNVDREVKVYLYVFNGTQRLTGPLSEHTRPRNLDTSSKSASTKQRSVDGGIVFNIPPAVVRSKIDIVAVAIPREMPSPDVCEACGPANGFALTGVEPLYSKGWRFRLIQVVVGDQQPPSVLEQIEVAVGTLPVDPTNVKIPATYSETIDGDSIGGTVARRERTVLAKLDEWDEAQGDTMTQSNFGIAVVPPSHLRAGIADGDILFTPKECFDEEDGTRTCRYNRPGIVVGDNQRPYTAVAHEIAHGLGRDHASTGCNGASGGPTESWPPDEQGYLNGIGFDIRSALRGNLRVLNGETLQAWDYMGYCAQEANAWTSPKGWEKVFLRLYGRGLPVVAGIARNRPARAAAAQTGLVVRAIAGEDGGVEITSVKPGVGAQGPAGSGYTLVSRDANGMILAAAPMRTRVLPAEGGGGTFALLDTTVAAPGAESLSIENAAGAELAAVRRSPNAPQVRVTTPARGARVGGGRRVRLAWSATDKDGGDLLSTIDYSADGGKSWRTIAETGDDSIDLDSRLLGASRRARVRVTVNDGWNQSQALSEIFHSLGAPPAVRVLEPTSQLSAANDQPVTLAATATDDRDMQLTGRAFTWKLGGRVIGRGERTTVTGLPAGRSRIVVEAADRLGRVGTARVRIRLSQATPFFTKLAAPRKLSRRARRVALRVATNVPARLKAGRRVYRVGPKQRRLVIRIAPSKRPLGLPLVLRAGGKRSRSLLIVKRD